MSRITLKDIAQHSGYSLRTVKKVMGNKEYVSDEVKKDILHIAKKLEYRPNKIASTLARNQEFKIALVYANISKYYFPEVEKGFRKCADEFSDFKISVAYYKIDNLDPSWQEDTLKQIAADESVHGIVLHPASISALDKEINTVVEAGKPVVTFGTDAPQSQRFCYIGPNAYKSGRIAAELMANYIGKKGNVYLINQSNEHMQTTERSRGFKDKLKQDYPGVNMEEIILLNNKKVYYDTIKSLILNEQNIAGLFSTDADVYITAGILKELNKKDDIVLIGYDLSEETSYFLKDGYIKVVLYQNPEYQGYMSLKVLCDYFLDGKLPEKKEIDVDVSIITGECI